MDSRPLAVRRMTESELALALDWAADEGWNPGLSDAECFCANSLRNDHSLHGGNLKLASRRNWVGQPCI